MLSIHNIDPGNLITILKADYYDSNGKFIESYIKNPIILKIGVTIIGVRRGKTVHSIPEPDFIFKKGDLLLFTGNRENMNSALSYFRGEPL
jgi:Trk K+ transport system NAD-binding subunit